LLTIWSLPGVAAAQPLALGERVERDGVSVAFVAGAEVRDVASDTWRATVQRVREGEVVVRVSRSEQYRGQRDAGARSRVRACGHDAERVVIESAESRAEPLFIEDGNVEHGPESVTPATTEVRVELEHRGLPVWISWSVRRDRRARYLASEDAFFRSIRCSSGPALGAPTTRHGIGIPFIRELPIDDRAPRRSEQRIAEADVVITVTPGASVRVPGQRFLSHVCGRNVDYASRTRGDRTESEVRVPRGRRAVRVVWSVPTARRAEWKWLEDSFFAAITCPP